MRPYTELYRRWIAVPGLHAADIAVLSALYAHADHNGVCAATQGELAEELGQSRAWINAILKSLQEPAVALVVARPHRGYRGFLYALTNAAPDSPCQPADTASQGANISLDSENPESSFSSNTGEHVALPLDWTPETVDLAWAQSQRPDVEPDQVTRKFVAWCRKAHQRNGYRPSDPSAAWKRWILRELVAPNDPIPDDPENGQTAQPIASIRRRSSCHDHSPRPSSFASGKLHVTGQRPVERGGADVVVRNQDTLAALRARLACPA
jgi:biotin operon repressor